MFVFVFTLLLLPENRGEDYRFSYAFVPRFGVESESNRQQRIILPFGYWR